MWENLKESQKLEYKKLILAFASLTEVFSQKVEDNEIDLNSLIPIINSKYQEKVFQKSFSAKLEDKKNTSFDVSLEIDGVDGKIHKYLIGIKTFRFNSGSQKIKQIKSYNEELRTYFEEAKRNADCTDGTKNAINQINKDVFLKLAKDISRIRNTKIDSDTAEINGFDGLNDTDIESVYHVLMPSKKHGKPVIYVGETTYDKIDIENITIKEHSNNKTLNFSFTDGRHDYHFTAADNQLWMNFDKKNIIKETWDVSYVDDAISVFSKIAKELPVKKQSFESYSWFICKGKELPSYSGFNSFFSLGSKLSKVERIKKLKQLKAWLQESYYQPNVYSELYDMVDDYFSMSSSNKKEKQHKEFLRDSIITKIKKFENPEFEEKIIKLLFRPKSEVYIPIPNARKFHKAHPDFFGPQIGTFKSSNSSKLNLDKENRTFMLVFEPSGQKMKAFITQDNGKAIESWDKQSIMGKWLINDVFQLQDYEKLTLERLEELNINGIRLEKNIETGEIHFSFIWIDKKHKPEDFIS